MVFDHPTVLHALQVHATHAERRYQTISAVINERLETKHIYFHDLYTAAVRNGNRLCACRSKPVVLLFTEGIDFLQAVLACWAAGAIPVSSPLPQRASQAMRLEQMARKDQLCTILMPKKAFDRFIKKFPSFNTRAFEFIWWEDVVHNTSHHGQATIRLPAPGDVALVQYSSGSTSDPKGIVITHANLVANSHMIRHAFALTPNDRSLSWLPHYHDMGLIDGLLQPLYTGFSAVLMPSLFFLQGPQLWFKALHHFRCTYSGGPNFAYDLCLKKVNPADIKACTGHTVRLLYNGAEHIKPSTLRLFSEKFGHLGYGAQKLVTCYGLAEATLAVSVAALHTQPFMLSVDPRRLLQNEVTLAAGGRELAASGVPVIHTSLCIINKQGKVLPEKQVGEVCVQSPAVCCGYWNSDAATAQLYHTINAAAGELCYLRTGDYGFIYQGHLFITGRKKDLLLLNGQNIYPQDLELSASEVLAGMGGLSAAFQPDINAAAVVLVQEVPRNLPTEQYGSFVAKVRNAVCREHNISLAEVVLVPRGDLLVTTSGKVQRQANKQKFLRGEFINLYMKLVADEN